PQRASASGRSASPPTSDDPLLRLIEGREPAHDAAVLVQHRPAPRLVRPDPVVAGGALRAAGGGHASPPSHPRPLSVTTNTSCLRCDDPGRGAPATRTRPSERSSPSRFEITFSFTSRPLDVSD